MVDLFNPFEDAEMKEAKYKKLQQEFLKLTIRTENRGQENCKKCNNSGSMIQREDKSVMCVVDLEDFQDDCDDAAKFDLLGFMKSEISRGKSSSQN